MAVMLWGVFGWHNERKVHGKHSIHPCYPRALCVTLTSVTGFLESAHTRCSGVRPRESRICASSGLQRRGGEAGGRGAVGGRGGARREIERSSGTWMDGAHRWMDGAQIGREL